MNAQERRDWALFADWCVSVDRDPIPADGDLIADYLTAFSGAPTTHGRRVRAIRLAHERLGVPLELPRSEPATALRQGANWASVPRALAQLPTRKHRKEFHVALRGRRDGWLIVLIGLVGLSREQARTVVEGDVALYPALSVCGRAIERAPLPAECPACAVTRWLRVVGAASFGWTSEVKEIVTPSPAAAEHDCRTGLDGTWRKAQTLLPHIDRYGWVSAVPMSARAVSATMAYRQSLVAVDDRSHQVLPAPAATGRFATASRDELASAYDDVDAQAAAILLRLKALVDEGDLTLDRIKTIGR